MKKTYRIAITLFIVIGSLGLWNQISLKNKMAVLVDNPDPNYLHDKVWFDASKWLNSGNYIKIDDFYLIKLNPIDLNKLPDAKYYLAYDIYHNMLRKKYGDLDRTANFHELVEKVISPIDKKEEASAKRDIAGTERLIELISPLTYEYLYSCFDKEKREPIIDTLLVSFSYKGEKYEMLIDAIDDKEEKPGTLIYRHFITARSIQSYGTFYKEHHPLTYKLYLEEKQKEKK
ncbi:hypothetical protein Ppb6_03428 [Photorhabdus australis subsp. thailandensis]|uniref:Uncharacterized protein n=1 Tax=Photorhabdus australis subsp. thailandensis TaxID=2805096 RepID=A0A1C0U0D5_9GAMM|nr:hypothetical protein [Photorhabdus australis]OCQ51388.1 hypothetical protein Ppb6_03428 [Photorhabdus australis subsp. thailandensis]